MRPEYEISLELFREVNFDMTEEEIVFCYTTLNRLGTIINAFYFKCLTYIRYKNVCLNIEDLQTYYEVSLKDFKNEFEILPQKFIGEDIKSLIFEACDYISKLKV